MTDAFIYDAVRTPRGKGKKDGSLHQITPIHLLKNLYDALRERNRLDTSRVDDVVLGVVTPIGEQGSNLARVSVLYAGWDERIAGVTQNRFCASGLESVNLAAMKVMSGQEDLVVAGGVESMSRWTMGSDGGAWYMDPRVNDALQFVPQGIGADVIATQMGYSRQDVDAFALRSHQRADAARREGRFARSLVPVRDVNGVVVLERDETIRPDTSLEKLGALEPSFAMIGQMGFDATALRKYTELEAVDHVHHAGNSSGIVDGAALMLIGSRDAGVQQGLKPRARIRATAVIGSDPTIMLTGTTPACRKALAKAGMNAGDIDLVEVNEAFAAVPMRTAHELGIGLERVNVNGGAIAMGHPLGATGCMLLGTALDELERTDQSTALVTLCVGAGMGIATIIERV
ncbi:acetyl-CoA acetyltransferase [Burkholderia singularis]|uniref:Acetyl-CoA acetyltransferase n=1 Tax=Burkholderia singularis TaxID=1503053 RepID=A0A103E0F2_9BURK|nr:acetyl-CoA C-acetyltransferase [Burkholderia singularis]KVE26042.1 acetyl-CoA acetyltransferase [Burkholderia singularis]